MTSPIHSASPKRLVVSFHDLAPATQPACEAFLAHLAHHAIPRAALLVIPCPRHIPIRSSPAFLDWLRAKRDAGHEVCLHGWSHEAPVAPSRPSPSRFLLQRVYTDREGEFLDLSTPHAFHRIRDGLAILHNAGIDPVGFVPPAWLAGPDAIAALRQCRLSYFTTLTRIVPLPDGRPILAPAVTWSSRSAPRRFLTRLWAPIAAAAADRLPIVRIAVHPADFGHPLIVSSIRSTLARLSRNRTAATYNEIVAR